MLFAAKRLLLDADLALIYGVTTGALNQAVRRNAERFPHEFAFHLKQQEFADLRSQFVTSKGLLPSRSLNRASRAWPNNPYR